MTFVGSINSTSCFAWENHKRILLICAIFVICSFATAQELPPSQTITRQAPDDIALVADFYPAPQDTAAAPVIIALHMLNSARAAYEPIIPDLREAAYAVLNVDMRGHGESGGTRDWDATIADVADWIDWLDQNGQLTDNGLVMMGASIGANVAIISCADSAACLGAIALSPGLDYRGVTPEAALVDGLADRGALLVAAVGGSSSSTAIRQMFLFAKGAVSARMYNGRAHGTRLFDSEYQNLSSLILLWLEQLFQSED